MKSYTDIEQSKKLAEILPLDSADAWWTERYEGKVTYDGQYIVNEEPLCYISFIKPSEINYSQDTVKDIPCWSLAALLDILPSEFKYYETTYEIDIRKYALTDDVDLYQIAYRNCKIDEDGHHSWKDMINTGEKEDFIDCCYEMILKLKEKDLL